MKNKLALLLMVLFTALAITRSIPAAVSNNGQTGYVAWLEIPDIGAALNLVVPRDINAEGQYYTDLPQTGCVFPQGFAYKTMWSSAGTYQWNLACDIIADHSDQEFARMKECVPGQTMAYVLTDQGTRKFLCVKNIDGYNTGDLATIQTADGELLANANPDGLIMYTCNGHWTTITVTYWIPFDDYIEICEPDPEPVNAPAESATYGQEPVLTLEEAPAIPEEPLIIIEEPAQDVQDYIVYESDITLVEDELAPAETISALDDTDILVILEPDPPLVLAEDEISNDEILVIIEPDDESY